ncbi:MAG: TonB-dependent receptor [Candidatus Cloacimonetes bacterium]|nr:TonB-dependent receptor [Candidatus Cloacimonadota bacterium]
MKYKVLGIVIIFVAGLSILWTAEPDTLLVTETQHRKVYDIEGVTITALATTSTLGYSQIKEIGTENLGSAVNVKDLLTDLPGLRITTGGKGETDLRIRNFLRKQVKIMHNGVPISGGYFGNVDLNALPVTDIEQINIIKGPVSALYGSNTLGGIINIVTNEVPPGWSHITRFSLDRSKTCSLSYTGSRGSRNNSFNYRLERSFSSGYYLSESFEPTYHEDGGIRENTGFSRYSVGIGWNGYLASIHNLNFQAGYNYLDNKDIPSSVYEASFRRFTSWHSYNTSLRYSLPLRYNLLTETKIYTDFFDNVYEEYLDSELTNPDLISDIRNTTIGFSTTSQWTLSDRLLTKQGYKYEYSHYKRKDNAYYSDWYSGATILQEIYFQPEYDLSDLFTLTIGGNLSSFDQDKPTYNFAGSSGIFLTFPSNMRFSLAYSSNIRYPIMRELFSSSVGNTDLLPEKANKFEITGGSPFRLGSSYGYAHLALFHNSVFDLIEIRMLSDGYSRRFENIGNTYNYGTDLEMYFIPYPFWQSNISYSFIVTDSRSDYDLLRIPRNNVIFSNRFKLSDNLTIRQSSEYCDVRDDLDNFNYPQKIPSYTIHNVNILYRYSIANIKIGVDNIFDTLYYEKYGFPSKGRNYYISLELKTNKSR